MFRVYISFTYFWYSNFCHGSFCNSVTVNWRIWSTDYFQYKSAIAITIKLNSIKLILIQDRIATFEEKYSVHRFRSIITYKDPNWC